MAKKKYYWLKLYFDFFQQRPMKKLRKIAGGDTYTIIYLKMQLLSIKNEGVIEFEGVEENMVEELALVLDEAPEDIQMTIAFLKQNGLLEEMEGENYLLPKAAECIGAETDSAERMRRLRSKRKELQSDDTVSHSDSFVTMSDTEIEIE